MSTISRPTGPPSRRPPTSSSPSPTPISSITRGATARAAASPRNSASGSPSISRRPSGKPAANGTAVNGEANDILEAALKKETDQKEQLMVQLQDKDQIISSLSNENGNLTSALHSAETRLNELYSDQSRSEMELAQRIDISEKLRAQVRELEKEKRDLQRRYNEQTSTFEAERQAFYDNEQHLKSRIQSLTQARKQPEPLLPASESIQSATESLDDAEPVTVTAANDENPRPENHQQDFNDPVSEPAEMTSLKLELSTLSTSHASLQSTLVLLQSQLVDLKRVNQELQEENESYMILLREKTLSGQYNVMRQVGAQSSSDSDEDEDEDDIDSMRSVGRNVLDRVEEEGPEDEFAIEVHANDAEPTSRENSAPVRPRRRGTQSPAMPHRGESLADLPITGPGLDLAAELGRAENKDILGGAHIDTEQSPGKGRRKRSDGRKIPATDSAGLEPSSSLGDVDALRSEVKSLKDANKALSLYASKIIDRIIAQEGFEHVLAVDYDKSPETPSTAIPLSQPSKSPPAKASKPRPQSVLVGRSSSISPAPVDTPRFESPLSFGTAKLSQNPPPPTSTSKAQRRSLSFDWKSFSIFNTEKKPENPALRPLTLKPGTIPVTGAARKLETEEDEEDRRERERLNATMKLMGIQPSPSPVLPSSPIPAPAPGPTAPASNNNRRFSFWGRPPPASEDNVDLSSTSPTPSISGSSSRAGLGIGESRGLTTEALEQAEAENSLAALDAHEQQLSSEIARGGSSGFTEIARRSSRRSRRSAGGSGSGSIVWSAGGEDTGEES